MQLIGAKFRSSDKILPWRPARYRSYPAAITSRLPCNRPRRPVAAMSPCSCTGRPPTPQPCHTQVTLWPARSAAAGHAPQPSSRPCHTQVTRWPTRARCGWTRPPALIAALPHPGYPVARSERCGWTRPPALIAALPHPGYPVAHSSALRLHTPPSPRRGPATPRLPGGPVDGALRLVAPSPPGYPGWPPAHAVARRSDRVTGL
jgi:hypothetical protein